MRECEELIERLDKEISSRQPILYPGHDDVDILRPDMAELNLDIPRSKKIQYVAANIQNVARYKVIPDQFSRFPKMYPDPIIWLTVINTDRL